MRFESAASCLARSCSQSLSKPALFSSSRSSRLVTHRERARYLLHKLKPVHLLNAARPPRSCSASPLPLVTLRSCPLDRRRRRLEETGTCAACCGPRASSEGGDRSGRGRRGTRARSAMRRRTGGREPADGERVGLALARLSSVNERLGSPPAREGADDSTHLLMLPDLRLEPALDCLGEDLRPLVGDSSHLGARDVEQRLAPVELLERRGGLRDREAREAHVLREERAVQVDEGLQRVRESQCLSQMPRGEGRDGPRVARAGWPRRVGAPRLREDRDEPASERYKHQTWVQKSRPAEKTENVSAPSCRRRWRGWRSPRPPTAQLSTRREHLRASRQQDRQLKIR